MRIVIINYSYVCGHMNDEMKILVFRKILADVLEIAEDEISLDVDTRLVGGLVANGIELSSIDYVEFMVKIEEEFNIVYEFDTQINTVSDLISYINHYSDNNKEGVY